MKQLFQKRQSKNLQPYRKKDCEMKKFMIPAVVVGVISALAVVLFLISKKKRSPVEIEV